MQAFASTCEIATLKNLHQSPNAGAKACASIAELVNISDVSCNVLVIAEMIALSKQTGVALEKIPEVLAGGFADSGPLQIVGPEMAAETFG